MLRFVPPPENGQPAPPPSIAEAAARMPPDMADRFRKPFGFGQFKALNFVNEIEHAARPPAPPNEWDLPIFFSAAEAVLAQIGRDLGLSPKKEK